MSSSTTSTDQSRRVAHPREKHAPEDGHVDERIRRRWSPRSFSDTPLTEEDLRALLEAARWAPSSFNEQPWRFIVARREDEAEFRTMLECINSKNREWAGAAPVLMLTVARRLFARDGRENRHAYHDVGLAMGNLINQAMSMDIYVHQMAGILPERARDVYRVPDEYDVVAGVALGHLGDPDELDDPSRRRAETGSRSRRPLSELVFEGAWGSTADFVTDEEAS